MRDTGFFEVGRGCDFVAPLLAVSPKAVSPEDIGTTCEAPNWIQDDCVCKIAITVYNYSMLIRD